jgi:septum formation protein
MRRGAGQKRVGFDTLRLFDYGLAMQLILASQSPYRKAQLENFGVEFHAHKPLIDEEALKREGPADLVELTRFLARRKAESLRATFPQAVILGSDQLAELRGRRLDKPGTRARAKEQLTQMQGRSHRLITTLVVHSPDLSQSFTDITTIHMRRLSEADIEDYLDVDQPYDCAGSYKIEKAGIALVQLVESQDPSAIQGLPLISLTTALLKMGIPLSQLRRKT